MALEREVKLRFADAVVARARVVATGAAVVRARRLQSDALFDTADGQLLARSCALRLRRDGERFLITFKGPPQPGPMKLREEHETPVGDGAVAQAILQGLGYAIRFRYEKYREEFALADALIAIDETPMGVFVEIEGSAGRIGEAAAALGCSAAEYITDSYRTLFAIHRQALGLPMADMVFPAASA